MTFISEGRKVVRIGEILIATFLIVASQASAQRCIPPDNLSPADRARWYQENVLSGHIRCKGAYNPCNNVDAPSWCIASKIQGSACQNGLNTGASAYSAPARVSTGFETGSIQIKSIGSIPRNSLWIKVDNIHESGSVTLQPINSPYFNNVVGNVIRNRYQVNGGYQDAFRIVYLVDRNGNRYNVTKQKYVVRLLPIHCAAPFQQPAQAPATYPGYGSVHY